MCRLFGMSGGRRRVCSTFWLLDAPDSLAVQSRAEPDGAGLGAFAADGTPVVHRFTLAAYEDVRFASEARELESTTFVAHVRYASTGAVARRNTHPFEQQGRLFAHNGVVGDLPRLERELGHDRELVHGDTDSERVFALITREAARNGGDITAAITAAARWVACELPLYALNIVLTTPEGLWALRYPDTHDLFVLERPAGGTDGNRHFEGASAAGRIRVRSAQLAETPAVIVASERMDEHPGWRTSPQASSSTSIPISTSTRRSHSQTLPPSRFASPTSTPTPPPRSIRRRNPARSRRSRRRACRLKFPRFRLGVRTRNLPTFCPRGLLDGVGVELGRSRARLVDSFELTVVDGGAVVVLAKTVLARVS